MRPCAVGSLVLRVDSIGGSHGHHLGKKKLQLTKELVCHDLPGFGLIGHNLGTIWFQEKRDFEFSSDLRLTILKVYPRGGLMREDSLSPVSGVFLMPSCKTQFLVAQTLFLRSGCLSD